MTYQYIRVEHGRIAKLTLNEPEKANAMSPEMAPEFRDAVAGLKADPEVRVVVLTGAGKAFSGGGRLEMIEELGRQPFVRNRDYMLDYYAKYMALFSLDVPVVAAINGAAVGAGMLIAMTADIRIASDQAKMGVNFVKLGLHPGLGGTFTLPTLLGYSRAAELFFTGRLVSGAEAVALGLVNRVVPPEQLLPEALAVAEEIAANAPQTIRTLKKNLKGRMLRELQLCLDDEAAAQASGGGPELSEGIAAAKEKRKPNF
jgi:enoyl-CoA hydratase/carnithine racemase